jgi:ATP:cob(I)alamin adenosyltransferase
MPDKVKKYYTCTGDNGTTLLNGNRVGKDNKEIELIGDIDELSANIGMCIITLASAHRENAEYEIIRLQHIRKILYEISSRIYEGNLVVSTHYVDYVEKTIEFISYHRLTEFKIDNFLTFDDSFSSAQLNIARTVCRRTERSFVKVFPFYATNAFFNRLSSLLFVMAVAFSPNKETFKV